MNTSSVLNMNRIQVSPSDVLTDVQLRWLFIDDRIVTELSYKRWPTGRTCEQLSPQALRRRLGIVLYKRVCDALRDAMARGLNSD